MRVQRHALFLAGAVSLMLGTACMKRRFGEAGQVQHVEGQPLRSPNPLQWRQTSVDEFKRIILPKVFVMYSEGDVLPESHALVQRAQFWLDAIASKMEERFGWKSGIPPRVKAVVAKDDSRNAFVDKIPMCVQFPVSLNASGEPYPGALGITRGAILWGVSECIDVTGIPIEKVVESVNSMSRPCEVSIQNGSIVFGDKCSKNDHWKRYSSSQKFMFEATASIVAISSGAFQLQKEEEFVALLAHEMAHYYRSHPIARESEFKAGFLVGDRNYLSRPVNNPELDEKIAEVLRLRGDRTGSPEIKAKREALEKEITEKRIALYTREQEADELGAEILASLGFQPIHLSDVNMSLLKVATEKQEVPQNELSFEQCAALRAQGWNGYVPVGDLSNAHHSSCFRAFNLDGEIQAHGYRVSPSMLQAPGGTWESVVNLAGHL